MPSTSRRDHEMFDRSDNPCVGPGKASALTDSPTPFGDGSRIEPIEQHVQFDMTSRGFRIAPPLYDSARMQGSNDESSIERQVVLLSCIYSNNPQ